MANNNFINITCSFVESLQVLITFRCVLFLFKWKRHVSAIDSHLVNEIHENNVFNSLSIIQTFFATELIKTFYNDINISSWWQTSQESLLLHASLQDNYSRWKIIQFIKASFSFETEIKFFYCFVDCFTTLYTIIFGVRITWNF